MFAPGAWSAASTAVAKVQGAACEHGGVVAVALGAAKNVLAALAAVTFSANPINNALAVIATIRTRDIGV